METKKVKVFIFAPRDAKLEKALAPFNNVRECVYITAHHAEPYMRIRVRKNSNGSEGIAVYFAQHLSPISIYRVGEGQGNELVGTIRIEAGKFASVVETVQAMVDTLHLEKKLPMKVRVSNILARDETPWVEILARKTRGGSVDEWKNAFDDMAASFGASATYHDAEVQCL